MELATASPQPAAKRQRIIGLELLRCVSTALIVFLHLVNTGGFANAVGVNLKPESLITVFITVFACCTVSIYGMISGYVMISSTFKLRRWFAMWFQVVATALAICVLFTILRPGYVSTEIWISTFLPISQKTFWYYSAYAGLYIFVPLLNRALNAMSNKAMIALSMGILVLFSCLVFVDRNYLNKDPFDMSNGYSMLWMAFMYVLGATMRKTQVFRPLRTGVIVALCVGCTLLCQAVLIASTYPGLGFLHHLKVTSMVNPLLMVPSILSVELFTRIRLGKTATKIVNFFAPLTFGVYLVHAHTLTYTELANRTIALAKLPSVLSILALIGAVLTLCVVCSLLEWVRQRVFRLCRVEKLCVFLETKTVALFERIYSHIDKA